MREEGFDEIDIPRQDIKLFQPIGCDKCTDGYKGRVGVYEVVRITRKFLEL